MWLDRVKKLYKGDLDITWKHFQLEQVNNSNSEFEIWAQPDQHQSRSLVAAMAGEAAKLQGEEHFERFHLALLLARHGNNGRIPLNEEEPIIKLAKQIGLKIDQFREDIRDRSLLENIARDHTIAVRDHGVFGTPTFVFANGNAAYLKTFIPPEEDSLSFFDQFVNFTSNRAYVGEIKRPQPPWPKGAIS